MVFQYPFFDKYENVVFSDIFKIKWQKSEKKINFERRDAWMPINPSPQAKLRGEALANRFQNNQNFILYAMNTSLIFYF